MGALLEAIASPMHTARRGSGRGRVGTDALRRLVSTELAGCPSALYLVQITDDEQVQFACFPVPGCDCHVGGSAPPPTRACRCRRPPGHIPLALIAALQDDKEIIAVPYPPGEQPSDASELKAGAAADNAAGACAGGSVLPVGRRTPCCSPLTAHRHPCLEMSNSPAGPDHPGPQDRGPAPDRWLRAAHGGPGLGRAGAWSTEGGRCIPLFLQPQCAAAASRSTV